MEQVIKKSLSQIVILINKMVVIICMISTLSATAKKMETQKMSALTESEFISVKGPYADHIQGFNRK